MGHNYPSEVAGTLTTPLPRIPANNFTVDELLAELDALRERVSNAEAELTRIKNGGGWYEDTPGGARKFCTVSEEQEVKTATEQVNTFRKLCEMMLIALRLHAGDLESGLIHRAREVLK